ncbi:hypothetical protein BGW39_005924 [Mortierella sp. 14UC]|nr:hypothetical protein BGW39_005924 [Mortierella sp. 14UC]
MASNTANIAASETASSRPAVPSGTTPAPGPWRPASFAGRSSPAPGSMSSRDHPESSLSSGMTPLRPSGAGAGGGGDRLRVQQTSSSGYQSSGSTSGAWVASSRRVPSAGQDRTYSEQSLSVSSSPILGSSGAFARQASMTSTSTLLSAASSGQGSTASGTQLTFGGTGGNGVGNGTGAVSSTSVPEQPLNMEALAAKFASSKETKEKFAALQLSPALVPVGTPDKERRNPMGAFAPASSSSNPHVAHIKVQRTAISGNKLLPGHHAQSTDMRRTASHNNAFSSGLGLPVSGGVSNGQTNGSAHNNANPHTDGLNGPSQSIMANGLSSPVLAPFSLGQMTRTTRRSSLNPQESGATHHQDHASPSQTPKLSSSMADKHPLQHPWTLYYTAGNNRSGSSLHIYENGLREVGTFTTVELFARYFNWIEKPHKIENSSDYHLFKDGIKPMWEDPANANGGRWTVTLLTKNSELLDRCWMELAYALVGEQLDLNDDICGADRLAVWVRDKDNVEAINGIGKRLIRLLDLRKEAISLEFLITTDAKSSGLLKRYITLDTIKHELAQEAEAKSTPTPAGNETTPSLTIDSVSVTPASAIEISPATPGPSQGSSAQGKESGDKTPTAIGTSGLLISVDGKGVFTA